MWGVNISERKKKKNINATAAWCCSYHIYGRGVYLFTTDEDKQFCERMSEGLEKIQKTYTLYHMLSTRHPCGYHTVFLCPPSSLRITCSLPTHDTKHDSYVGISYVCTSYIRSVSKGSAHSSASTARPKPRRRHTRSTSVVLRRDEADRRTYKRTHRLYVHTGRGRAEDKTRRQDTPAKDRDTQ